MHRNHTNETQHTSQMYVQMYTTTAGQQPACAPHVPGYLALSLLLPRLPVAALVTSASPAAAPATACSEPCLLALLRPYLRVPAVAPDAAGVCASASTSTSTTALPAVDLRALVARGVGAADLRLPLRALQGCSQVDNVCEFPHAEVLKLGLLDSEQTTACAASQ